jgi:hypothetical protein
MRIALLSILMLISSSAQAVQLVPKWGFEKSAFSVGLGTGVRLWGLEAIHPIGDHALLKLDGGVWISREKGKATSAYLTPAWGYRIRPFKDLVGEAFIGPGWVQNTDTELGSHFQIFHSINLGMMNDEWGLTIGGTHISCAGLCSPNRGKDFICMRFVLAL